MTIAETRQTLKRAQTDYVNDANDIGAPSPDRCRFCNESISERPPSSDVVTPITRIPSTDECTRCATRRDVTPAEEDAAARRAVAAASPPALFSAASRTGSSIGEESGDLISAIGSPMTSQKSAHEMTPTGDAVIFDDGVAGSSRHTVADAAGNSNYRDSSRTAARKTAGTDTSMRRHFAGSVLVNLPEGTIVKCQPASCDKNIDGSRFSLMELAPGESLLRQLHGKGAQTLLLNAFCGQTKRRMYARLKWGDTENISACEFLCEFSVDGSNSARRLANIQIYCIDATASMTAPAVLGLRHIFTTRHNSSCAVIYLDSSSIPVLGHFPSEITGKSLFALIHADNDVEAVKQAHRDLREKRGGEIVATPGLHFRTYQGGAVRVNSEWTAFVNPWTGQVEMVVGRHTVIPEATGMESNAGLRQTDAAYQLRRHDADIFSILSKPAEQYRDSTEPVVDVTSGRTLSQAVAVETDENNNTIGTTTVDNIEVTLAVSAEENVGQKRTSKIENASKSIVNCKVEAESPAISLSYNQINCLENVHRLLKSQAKTLDETVSRSGSDKGLNVDSPSDRTPVAMPLTRELLEMHDQKWETECKYNWRKRLANKRVATSPPDVQTEPKIQRTVANSHTNSSSVNEYSRGQAQFVTQNNNTELQFLPSPSPHNTSDISKNAHSTRLDDCTQTVGNGTLNEYLTVALQSQIHALIASQRQKSHQQQQQPTGTSRQQKLCLTPQTVALMNNLFLQYKQRLQQQHLQ